MHVNRGLKVMGTVRVSVVVALLVCVDDTVVAAEAEADVVPVLVIVVLGLVWAHCANVSAAAAEIRSFKKSTEWSHWSLVARMPPAAQAKDALRLLSMNRRCSETRAAKPLAVASQATGSRRIVNPAPFNVPHCSRPMEVVHRLSSSFTSAAWLGHSLSLASRM